MIDPFRNIARKLSFRIVLIIFLVNVLLAAGFYAFLLKPISETAESMIKKSINDVAQDIYRICEQSYDEIMRLGFPETDPAVRVKRGYSVGLIERFMRSNDVMVLIMDDEGIVLKPESVPETLFAEIHNAVLQEVSLLDLEGKRYYGTDLHFDPWTWHIMVLKHAEAFGEIKRGIYLFYAITIILLITGSVIMMYYFNRVIASPLDEIVGSVKKGKLPVYHGIDEFEYLSRNLSSAIVEAGEKTAELEQTNVDLRREMTVRKEMEKEISRSLEEKEVLLEELHHRVKNNFQVILSMLRLKIGDTDNESVKTILAEFESRFRSMALSHEMLSQSPDMSSINMRDYIHEMVKGYNSAFGGMASRHTVTAASDDLSLGIDAAMSVGVVMNELVTNAVKHAFPGGRTGTISISMKRNDSGHSAILVVQDNGEGVPEHVDMTDTNASGLRLVASLVEKQLCGTIELVRGQGSMFRITFPAGRERSATHFA